ncbi:MAG: formyltransferase family protein [Fuerstiella sp.]
MASLTNKPTLLLCLDSSKGATILQEAFQYRDLWQLLVCVSGRPNNGGDEIRNLANRHDCRVITNQESHSCSAEFCQENNVARIFCVGWRFLIRQETLNLLPGQVLVAHDSLLPRLRGFAPVATAILSGEAETGVSLIHAVADVDAGNIIWQEAIHIESTDTATTLTTRLLPLYVKSLRLAVAADVPSGLPQNHTNATYSIWRDEQDYRIQWHSSAKQIESAVRALAFPFDGAQTILNGDLVTITSAEIAQDMSFAIRQPGKIWHLDEHGCPTVVCGSGMLKITEATRNKKTILPIKRLRQRFE